MTTKIALCADSKSLEDASSLGLRGERILDQTWIVPFTNALIARKYLREHAVEETWVVSSDSVDGINLAAALKKDDRRNKIRLFLPSPSGSKMSRCQNAGIMPICGCKEFVRLYTAHKLESAMPQTIEQVQMRDTTLKQKAKECEPKDPNVSVTRVRQTRNETTQPLPKIEIEESPAVVPDNQSSSPVPERKGFVTSDHTAEEHKTSIAEQGALSIGKQTIPACNEGANIISVVSGSGGTGKSSITALSALLAQRRGIRTLVLDADLQFGDLKYLLGYKETLAATDILEHPEQIESLLKVETWPVLLAAPGQLEYSEVVEKRIGELLSYLKPYFDLIVVNTGSSWSEAQMQLLEASNNVFFLVDQRPSSVRACNHALDLCARCGIATTSFSYLLNFCSKKSLLSSLDVSCALKGAKVHEVKDGGSEVSELMGAGMAHKLSRLNNAFCSSIETILIETVYDRIKPSLTTSDDTSLERIVSESGRVKHRGRQKKRAACF